MRSVSAHDEVVFVSQEGNSEIPEGGYVYSLDADVACDIEQIKVGMPAQVMHECSAYAIEQQEEIADDLSWEAFDFVINGNPVLIAHGTRVQNFTPGTKEYGFHTSALPRTAIGRLQNGNWLFVLVDGRMPDFSMGMTIAQLADFMHAQGCVEAINLDGGGSSVMYLDGSIVSGRGKGGRPVSDGIVVVPRG